MRLQAPAFIAAGAAAIALLVSCAHLASPHTTEGDRSDSGGPSARKAGEWITWGGDLGNTRYSPLSQINEQTVDQLEIAWRWKASDVAGRPDPNWKATPLVVDGVMYIAHGGTRISAIDPSTGATLWTFEPVPYRKPSTRAFSASSRGLSWWTDGKSRRILHNTVDGRLLSIDAVTGQPDPAFGDNGQVDLRNELLPPDDPRTVLDVNSTSPGIVVGDVIVVQVIGDDTIATRGGTPGYVRGYDVRTGRKLWTFHTIPRPGEYGHETWEDGSWREFGAASVWTMMSADPDLGMVYLPVESPTNNFWGGQRPGAGLFGESIVALDARTGVRRWHYQIVHHGLWDYDLPAAPILHDIQKDGRTIKAITVLTKQGMNFVFDRVTGEPVWPIEERPVPVDGVPGERPSPTQPFPTKPAPYSRLGFHDEDVVDFTPALKAEALDFLSQYTRGPMYTPPSVVTPTNKGTIVYPSFGGGANWNGGAVDIESNTLFVPTRNAYTAIGLRRADPARSDWHYAVGGGGVLTLPNGIPANRPPWALVTATDMNRGEHVWSRSIGSAPDDIRNHPLLKDLPLDFDNMGQIGVRPSPLVTKSLLFMAESGNLGGDPGGRMFRAYDKATGRVVHEIELPGLVSGAPMTYEHRGRQYIAMALSAQGQTAELVVLSLPGARMPSAAGVVASETPKGVPAEHVDATSGQLAEGRELFVRHCSACHGTVGQGVPGGNAPPLGATGSLADVTSLIGRGGPEMPGFSAVLAPEQVDAIARYVKVGLSSAARKE